MSAPRGSRTRGRGARRGTLRNLELRLRNLQRAQNGFKLVLSPDPPAFTQIPWNSITLDDTVTLGAAINSKVYTASTLCNVLKAQTGLSQPNAQISLRITEVNVWEVSGKPLTLEVIDLTVGFGSVDYLVQLEDVAGRNQWARVGYRYPESQNKVILSGDDSESIIQVNTGLAASLVSRFKIMWKVRINTLPNIRQRVRDLLLVDDQM